jgi:hypothetical protein
MKSYKYIHTVCMLALMFLAVPTYATEGFVELPKEGFAKSAYILCNQTGEFGLKPHYANSSDSQACLVVNDKLSESPMNGPLDGFSMVGMISRAVNLPAPYVSTTEEFATLTDTVWHNGNTNECIYGTHVLMKDQVLANGQRWEINDIVRGGFSGRPVSIAYFMKPVASNEYEIAGALYRAGRTDISIPYIKGYGLPALSETSSKTSNIRHQLATVNDNWVDFTIDINFDDPDGVTHKKTPMLYIKTSCEQREPEEKDGAIRLRTTGQNGQTLFEIDVPGLVPAGASVN